MVLAPKKLVRIEVTKTHVSVYLARDNDDVYEPEIRIGLYKFDDGFDEEHRLSCTYFDGKQAHVLLVGKDP